MSTIVAIRALLFAAGVVAYFLARPLLRELGDLGPTATAGADFFVVMLAVAGLIWSARRKRAASSNERE
jgi:hypothetical protein